MVLCLSSLMIFISHIIYQHEVHFIWLPRGLHDHPIYLILLPAPTTSRNGIHWLTWPFHLVARQFHYDVYRRPRYDIGKRITLLKK